MAFNKKQVDGFLERGGFDLENGRKTMDALRSRFNKIKRELDKDGRFQAIDETVIETLVMAIEVRDRAYMSIIEDGTLMFVDRRKKVKQKNHNISTLREMAHLILQISKKLGMSPMDRFEMKLESKTNDGFDDED